MANEVRLIDANALHKILEEAQDGTRRIYSSLVDYRDKEVCKGELGTYARAKRMVEEAPTIDGGKWTPTDERLPEHGDVVLCHHKQFHHVVCKWDKRHNLWLDSEWEYGADYITHWMPLPEPPKGE